MTVFYDYDPSRLALRIQQEGLLQVVLSFDGDAIEEFEQLVSDALSQMGWQKLPETAPEIDRVVVCTDGRRRWLDMVTDYSPKMKWDGHEPTHWHYVANLPAATTPKEQ